MPEASVPRRRVLLRIHRYSPETGRRWVQEVEVPLRRGMTVLDALLYVKARVDPSLSFRYSCRMGACGSCGVLVNGVPRLACQTQVESVARGGVVEVAPLPGYPVVRDLIVDMTRMFENHRRIRPYIVREGSEREGPEYLVKPEEMDEFLQYSLCIMCGLCNAACPVYRSSITYLGPQALSQAYRWTRDPRDQGWELRAAVVASPDGCYACHMAASCSAVCPKAVDPAAAIQRLRSIALRSSLGLWRQRPAPEARGPAEPMRRVEARPPVSNLVEGVRLEELEEAEVLEDIDPVEPPETPLAVHKG